MARKTLYSEYLKVLNEPDSPHKRRVMARMEAKYRNPSHPSDYGVPPKSKTKWIDPSNFSNYSAPIRDLIQRDIKRESRRQVAAYYESRGINITADDGPATLGSKNLHKHFRGITKAELSSGNFSKPITFLDIETGHNYTPISTAALKGVIDKRTGEFRVIDKLERYYIPQNAQTASFNISRETHGITPDKARAIRALQGATYAETYDYQEKLNLLNFLKGSTIAGHNIEEFDLDKLGLRAISQNFNVIDTLTVAENLGIRRGKRSLADMFKKFTGRSLRQAGYSHHIGFHDVMSNAELFSALYALGGKAGRDIRYVTNHRGFSYAPYESVAGTSIVHGGFYNAKGHGGVSNYMYEDEFDENGVFEYEYDENGRRILPEGYSEVRDDDIEPPLEVGSTDVMALKTYSKIASAYEALTEEMSRAREHSIGFNFSQESQLHARLANMPPGLAIKYAKNRGYKGAKLEKLLDDVEVLRNSKLQRQSAKDARTLARQKAQVADYLDHLSRSGQLSKGDYEWLSQVNYVTDSGFSPTAVKYMAQEKAAEREERLRDIRSQRKEELRKEKYLDRMERRGLISSEERTNLGKLTGSYEELVDATDDVIKKNQELLSIYEKIGNIRPYDINQLIGAAKGQWGGITSAASGVVPRFVLNPLTRLGNAAFNSIDRSVSPWNAVQRTWNSGLGSAVTGALTAGMGPAGMGIGMMLTGGVNTISQIAGNTAQARLEMAGLNIQNNLNVLGAMISWIATPFQLLHRAAKTLIGSFSGLSLGINKFMQSSIGLMSQMGNPLEQLTGVGYSSYLGTTALDMATLNRGGTLNSTIEDFAKQSRALYGLGQVNNTRMIAASMLGVFDSVYTPTTDAAGAYYNTANKILRSMQGQSAEQQANTLYWATNLDSYMGGLIRSAMLLGETDVRNLTDPSRSGMYWRPLGVDRNGNPNDEEARFRRTQYEFGSATQQFGFSRMRLGNKLWEAVGKDLYNSLNRLVDAAAGGDWKGVLEEAKSMWEMLKEKVKGVWEAMSGNKGGTGLWGKFADGFNKASETIVTWGAKIAKTIITVWDDIFLAVLNKAQGLIAYLSTIKIEPTFEGGKLGFNLRTIKDYKPEDKQRIFKHYRYQGDYYLNGTEEGMSELGKLAKILFPTADDEQLAKMTVGDLKKEWIRRGTYGNWQATDLSMFGLSGLRYTAEDAQTLIDYLGMRGAPNEMWGEAAAAYATSWNDYVGFDRNAAYNTTGLYTGAQNLLKNELEPIVDTIIDRSAEKLTIRLEISDASGAVKQSMDVNKGGVADSGFLTWLQDLLPDDLRLRVVTH